jgi:lipopolysaccharide/colanic/teichoic acid biosynthesis glycosyltransferase
MSSESGTTYARWGKRLLDVTVAAVMLLVLLPVLVAVAIAARVAHGTPVLFRELRAGRGGVPFTLLKFRTMSDERDASGRPRPDAVRLTRIGRVLRQWSLDELPQLLHVLAGDMSLVGPRPLPLSYVARYAPEQARRLEVTPGLTGLAQVRGRNGLDWDERFALDVWYVDHLTMWLDLKLLLTTVRIVATREGVSHPSHATMYEFSGRAQR